jgi:hypothetical protein
VSPWASVATSLTLEVCFKWNPAESESEVQVHHQKIKVVYLPPEGQTLEEEPEEAAAHPSQQTIVSEDSRVCGTAFVCLAGSNGLSVAAL